LVCSHRFIYIYNDVVLARSVKINFLEIFPPPLSLSLSLFEPLKKMISPITFIFYATWVLIYMLN
jgi:hypothetical protein